MVGVVLAGFELGVLLWFTFMPRMRAVSVEPFIRTGTSNWSNPSSLLKIRRSAIWTNLKLHAAAFTCCSMTYRISCRGLRLLASATALNCSQVSAGTRIVVVKKSPLRWVSGRFNFLEFAIGSY